MNVTTEQLFIDARTHNGFTNEPVSTAQLHAIYDLMKWAPTSANSSPARIVFVTSPEAREKLLGCVSPGNVEKTRSAPVTAIIGVDMVFYDKLPRLFPHADAKSGSPARRSSPTPPRFATRACRARTSSSPPAPG